jgi:hypothetical protein
MFLTVSIGIVFLFFGCSQPARPDSSAGSANSANAANESANATKTNVEELGMLINMPIETEEAVWRNEPGQKRIIAVLRFSPNDAQRFVEQAEKIRKPTNASIGTESWFPAELIAQSDQSGDDTLKGISYAADDFYQAPYTQGRIVRIENTDYFVLELTAGQ